MNRVCNFCVHQRPDRNGEVRCGAATYTMHDGGYGPFKEGSVCIYDSDLRDRFDPTSKCETILDFSQRLKAQCETISKQRDEINILRERLTRIEE